MRRTSFVCTGRLADSSISDCKGSNTNDKISSRDVSWTTDGKLEHVNNLTNRVVPVKKRSEAIRNTPGYEPPAVVSKEFVCAKFLGIVMVAAQAKFKAGELMSNQARLHTDTVLLNCVECCSSMDEFGRDTFEAGTASFGHAIFFGGIMLAN